MDKLIVEGGAKLKGEVEVSGSKNASLPILTAALLTRELCTVTNVPDLADVETMRKLFLSFGVQIEGQNGEYRIQADKLDSLVATYDIVRKMRASVLVLAPLVARFGQARVSLPGGCAIGARPIDIHLKGLEAMGAEIKLSHGYVEAKVASKGLQGAKLVLDLPSVNATQNLMMAGCLASGTTLIKNAAREPEVIELAHVLKKMGAEISGAGESEITVQGKKELKGFSHEVGPDRIETGTLLAAGAITGGDITLKKVCVAHQGEVIRIFRELGCEITAVGKDVLKVKGPSQMRAVDVRTEPFPGFATDMQAQLVACLSVAKGTSHVEETIFENRYMHVLELSRMGADISLHGSVAVITGVDKLSGAPVMATDLRASASLVLAALKAQGKSEILRIYHLDRGYVRLEEKLSQLGAKISRMKQNQEERSDEVAGQD